MPQMTIEHTIDELIDYMKKKIEFEEELGEEIGQENPHLSKFKSILSLLKRMQDVELPSLAHNANLGGAYIAFFDYDALRQSATAQIASLIHAAEMLSIEKGQLKESLASADVQIAALKEKLNEAEEQHRMQMAGISTASSQNTRESLKQRIENGHPYWTPAYGDMCVTVDREIFERERAEKSEAENAKLTERLRAAEENSKRYCGFRAIASTGDLTNKKWREAFEKWFARYYSESDLDAAIDAALSAREGR